MPILLLSRLFLARPAADPNVSDAWNGGDMQHLEHARAVLRRAGDLQQQPGPRIRVAVLPYRPSMGQIQRGWRSAQ